MLFVGATVAARTTAAGPNDDSRMAFTVVEVATASAPADTVLYDLGLAFGYYSPAFDASVSFGGASAPLLTGDRTAYNAVPAIGYHIGWNKRHESIIQLYGAARLPLQTRTGAALASATGLAVAAEVGVRLWACSRRDPHLKGWCVGVNIGTRYQMHLSDFQMGPAVLPAGSAVWSFPISFGLAINPDL